MVVAAATGYTRQHAWLAIGASSTVSNAVGDRHPPKHTPYQTKHHIARSYNHLVQFYTLNLPQQTFQVTCIHDRDTSAPVRTGTPLIFCCIAQH